MIRYSTALTLAACLSSVDSLAAGWRLIGLTGQQGDLTQTTQGVYDIKEKLSSKYQREKDIENTWSQPLQRLLQDTPVSLIAELGRTQQTVGTILNLRTDDVILLPTGPEDAIVIRVDHVPKFLGYPGVIKGSRAVEISTLLTANGGTV